MQVIFQTGAHSTEHERLLKCLLMNKEIFAENGVFVPGPGRYRALLKNTFEKMETTPPQPDDRDALLDQILNNEVADRILLSNTHFFGIQRDAFGDNTLYPLADKRVAQLARLFEYDQVEVFMAIRNPATFVPAVLTDAPPHRIRGLMEKLDMRALRWSELIGRMRAAAPNVQVTVWCNEDAPLIWSQILREMAGLEHGTKITGSFALLSEIMSNEGMSRFRAYLHQHKDMTEMHKRRVIAAFLDKYALDEAVEEEIDLPGWTEDLVEDMTEIYDEDVFEIQRIPGVQFIAP